ncbi:hypothetical protein BDW22DRAFT_1468571 [Trametopsis cervina]|nr:hypothetical protein BDW22DRAFT_1468571 [Trametopsis cervina]
MQWQYSGSSLKSAGELDRLVNEVLLADDFDRSELLGFSAHQAEHSLDEYSEPSGIFSKEDGWHETTVKISLPKEGVKASSEADAPVLEVKGLWHRRLRDVIRSAYEDVGQATFHNIPFKLFHHRSNNHQTSTPDERVYSELYTADAMLEEQAKIDNLPRNPDDDGNIEYIVAPLMMYSDATHLTNFGAASLWPFYLSFGSTSKYIRAKPSSFAAHHIAYAPKLPDLVQDEYQKVYNTAATSEVLRFCRTELIQAIWATLLDADFMHAYEHGMLVTCGDGIVRRIFPRFLTYSADYPERVALTCIRFLGACPCPTCLAEKAKVAAMGSKLDMKRRNQTRQDTESVQSRIVQARSWIFTRGYRIKSAMVERLLGPLSLLPCRSTFSQRLAPFGVNFYSMFVPDIMHECELGIWKAHFTHILRVLFAFGDDNLLKLNVRFRNVPTFGRDTIRKFQNNISGMKQFAARDFEDCLQCILPCVEGLLPEPFNQIVLDAVWDMAVWHALAKLRLHTESTLEVLDLATVAMGQSTRHFAKETAALDIRDLPAKKTEKRRSGKVANEHAKPDSSGPQPKRRLLNLATFKWHNAGHVAAAIRRFGTTDNYTTQIGELEHRRVKKFYPRTSRKGHTQQIAQHTRREKVLNSIATRESARRLRIATHTSTSTSTQQPQPPIRKRGRPRKSSGFGIHFKESGALPPTAFRIHHHLSESQTHPVDVTQFVLSHPDDPAVKNFIPLLKNHLLSRLIGKAYSGDEIEYGDAERLAVQFRHNRIYFTKTLRVNYTTYDMRRDQDSLNPRNHADVMVLAHEDEDSIGNTHPYWYARIIGVCHAQVRYLGADSRSNEYERIEFLWIRWFGRDMTAPGGFNTRRLHRVGFLDADEPGAFGFLDPAVVIRAVHLIPAFHYGRTDDWLRGPSIARQYTLDDADAESDWRYHYVNMFVDRDMFLRFVGGGIGHKLLRELVHIQDTLKAMQSHLSRTSAKVGAQADNMDGMYLPFSCIFFEH